MLAAGLDALNKSLGAQPSHWLPSWWLKEFHQTGCAQLSLLEPDLQQLIIDGSIMAIPSGGCQRIRWANSPHEPDLRWTTAHAIAAKGQRAGCRWTWWLPQEFARAPGGDRQAESRMLRLTT